jgi:hypothetical protein
MKIGERDASVLLSDEGREVLKQAALDLEESLFLSVRMEDSDDIGIWIRVNREDGDHMVLITLGICPFDGFCSGSTQDTRIEVTSNAPRDHYVAVW